MTATIFLLWSTKVALSGKLELQKGIKLFWPLLFLITTQAISTVFSIDPRTSLLGYYSRFNGGLIATICFALLHFAYINNINKRQAHAHLQALVVASVIVALVAIIEHFGIILTCPNFINCWDQNASNRAISTFGQPNWLAAWLTAILPLVVILTFSQKSQFGRIIFILTSTIILLALIYTKSRSGFLASLTIFPIILSYLFKNTKNKQIVSKKAFFTLFFIISLLIPFFGKDMLREKIISHSGEITSSAEIRKIVWKGAVDIWRNNPLIGSGVETFYLSFEKNKPPELNKTIEWNFIFNKAHNEFLNILANAGVIGFTAYIFYISKTLILLSPVKNSVFGWAFFLGFIAILITNFFGFSVSSIYLLTFLFPAIKLVLDEKSNIRNQRVNENHINSFPIYNLNTGKSFGTITKVVLNILSICVFIFAVKSIYSYWYADFLFAKGVALIEKQSPEGSNLIEKAVTLSPKEPFYISTLAFVDAGLAINLNVSGNTSDAQALKKISISEAEKSVALSPNNPSILKKRAETFEILSLMDPAFVKLSSEKWREIVSMYPNSADSKLAYAISLFKLGKLENSLEETNALIKLKPGYKEARTLLSNIYQSNGEYKKAEEQLLFILNEIEPNDQKTKETLELLRQGSPTVILQGNDTKNN